MTLELDDFNLVPQLRIALGSCMVPTRALFVDPATSSVSLSGSVPSFALTEINERTHHVDGRIQVPVYILVAANNAEIEDSWFVSCFYYFDDVSRKRSSAEFDPLTGHKRWRREPSGSAGLPTGSIAYKS